MSLGTASRWNTLKLEGAVSGPLSDRARGRLAFQVNQSDGYYKNNGNAGVSAGRVGPYTATLNGLGSNLGQPDLQDVIPPNDLVPADSSYLEQDNYALRGTLDIDLSDTLDLTASLHFAQDSGDMLVRSMNGSDFNGYSPADDDPYTIDANYGVGGPEVDIQGFGGYVKLDADLGFATLTSITGYETIDHVLPYEESSPWRMVDQLFTEEMWEFSQELRLTSNNDSDVFWMSGLYYGKEDIEARKDLNGLDGILRGYVITEHAQKGETYAAFVHTEWQLSDTMRLSAGLRYTDDEKSYAGGWFAPNPPFGYYGTGLFGVILGLPYFDDREFGENNVSGKIGLDWTPTDQLLMYLTWNKGYKSGGFDGSTITDSSSFTPFLGEDLYAWELGMKRQWADRRVQWNVAAFVYDFKEMQAEAQREVLPSTFESIRANVGEAEI